MFEKVLVGRGGGGGEEQPSDVGVLTTGDRDKRNTSIMINIILLHICVNRGF